MQAPSRSCNRSSPRSSTACHGHGHATPVVNSSHRQNLTHIELSNIHATLTESKRDRKRGHCKLTEHHEFAFSCPSSRHLNPPKPKNIHAHLQLPTEPEPELKKGDTSQIPPQRIPPTYVRQQHIRPVPSLGCTQPRRPKGTAKGGKRQRFQVSRHVSSLFSLCSRSANLENTLSQPVGGFPRRGALCWCWGCIVCVSGGELMVERWRCHLISRQACFLASLLLPRKGIGKSLSEILSADRKDSRRGVKTPALLVEEDSEGLRGRLSFRSLARGESVPKRHAPRQKNVYCCMFITK